MPYIRKEDRKHIFCPQSGRLDVSAIQGPGELNYAFAVLIKTYVGKYGTSYATFNDVIGALECNKLETYRRLVAPYEDVKRSEPENGDVYYEDK